MAWAVKPNDPPHKRRSHGIPVAMKDLRCGPPRRLNQTAAIALGRGWCRASPFAWNAAARQAPLAVHSGRPPIAQTPSACRSATATTTMPSVAAGWPTESNAADSQRWRRRSMGSASSYRGGLRRLLAMPALDAISSALLPGRRLARDGGWR
jgi:hypothetical protein